MRSVVPAAKLAPINQAAQTEVSPVHYAERRRADQQDGDYNSGHVHSFSFFLFPAVDRRTESRCIHNHPYSGEQERAPHRGPEEPHSTNDDTDDNVPDEFFFWICHTSSFYRYSKRQTIIPKRESCQGCAGQAILFLIWNRNQHFSLSSTALAWLTRKAQATRLRRRLRRTSLVT